MTLSAKRPRITIAGSLLALLYMVAFYSVGIGFANLLPIPVLDGNLRAIGMVLYPGHPGRVWSTLTQHVQVTWVGLEDEPATYALGFSLPSDGATCYPSLGLLTEDEFTRRERALQDRLATRTNLSGWVPPWSRGDSPP